MFPLKLLIFEFEASKCGKVIPLEGQILFSFLPEDTQSDNTPPLPEFLKMSLLKNPKKRLCEKKSIEDLVTVQIHPDDESNTAKISALLASEQQTAFKKFLTENVDVFTWSHSIMPGINLDFMVHKLNINPSFRSIRHRRQLFNSERYDVVKAEVDKLLQAGFIKEVYYPSWLSNVIMVKKSNG